MIAILLVQAGFLAAVLLWLRLTRAPTTLWAGVLIGAALIALLGAGFVGIWVYPPAWSVALLAGAALLWLSVRLVRRAGVRPSATMVDTTMRFGGVVVWAFLGGVLIWHGVIGRQAPSAVLGLAAPLDGAGFCAISGGASPLLNFHLETLAPGKEAYRGQSYGVDFIAISPLGLRTTAAHALEQAPSSPDAYNIFGVEVRAPCAGEAVAAYDGMTDQNAGVIDRSVMAGNHVVLRCDGYDVLLAHLRQGTVAVALGQRVEVGARLGEVGNTGATDEPHLHVSAQRATPQASFGGEPIHVTFNGRFVVRGACL